MKTKLFLFLAVAVLLGACTRDPKVWDEVEYLHSTADAITVTNVEFTDTATILSIHEKNTPSWGIRIPEYTRLVGNKGKEYKIIGGEGIVIGEQFVTPEGGEAHFKLLFEPMPKRTHYFDYIESYSVEIVTPYHSLNRWSGQISMMQILQARGMQDT